MNLDEFQLKYYNTELKPNKCVLLHAVAGSGKTHTTLAKAIKLINEGKHPDRILLTSFTNNASKELMLRYNKSIHTKTKPIISTLHGFGRMLLRMLGIKRVVIGEWKSILIARDALQQILGNKAPQKLTELTSMTTEILEVYSKLRNNSYIFKHTLETDLKALKLNHRALLDETIKDTILAYERAKEDNSLMDYDDMIWLVNSYFKQGNKELAKIADTLLDYYFIDEVQDLSQSQYDLILSCAKGKSLTMVGDLCQSIYGFRDAVPQNFSESYMKQYFNEVESLTLQNNYRSEPDIVKVCNYVRDLAQNNIHAIAVKDRTQASVKIVQTANNILEGKYLTDRLKEFELQGYKPRDIVIICRTNRYIKSVIEPAMVNANLKYRVLGNGNARRMLEKPLSRFFVNVISYVVNPKDNYSLVEVLKQIKGIGQSNLQNILIELDNNSLQTRHEEVSSIKAELSRIRLECQNDVYSIVDNVINLARDRGLKSIELTEKNIDLVSLSVANYITLQKEIGIEDSDEILQAMLQEIGLFDINDETNTYKLATVHSQKGCESLIVFAMGFNLQTPSQYMQDAEEANILYTQLSRAIKLLYIVDSREYITRKGDLTNNYKNPYLKRLFNLISENQ